MPDSYHYGDDRRPRNWGLVIKYDDGRRKEELYFTSEKQRDDQIKYIKENYKHVKSVTKKDKE